MANLGCEGVQLGESRVSGVREGGVAGEQEDGLDE